MLRRLLLLCGLLVLPAGPAAEEDATTCSPSDPTTCSPSDPAADAALVDWAAAADGVVLNVTVGRFAAEGRGLAAAGPVKRGEMLSWIPRAHALSMGTTALPASARRLLESRVAAFTKGTGWVNNAEPLIHLAVLLVFEESLGDGSAFSAYTKSLPETPPPNAATWTARQLRLLKGFIDHAHIGSICPSQVDENLGALAAMAPPHQPETLAKFAGEAAADLRREKAVWACAVVMSRYYGDALYPLSDMANHDPTSGFAQDTLPFSFDPACLPPMLECRFESGECRNVNDMYKANAKCADDGSHMGRGAVALRDYEAGEQVFDYYGSFDNVQMLAQCTF